MFPSVTLNKNTWTTKDGQVKKPKDFTDSHLVNTIKYLERSASWFKDEESLALLSVNAMEGEITYELLALAQQDPLEWMRQNKIYKLLKKEARRRKLKI